MQDIVTIYVLIDPITLKVRYIGRTRVSLQKRLQQHVCKSKRNYDNNTHKGNWIRSLIKMNSRPFIKKLITVDGWKESHQLERSLINKHKDKHNLVNSNDRGEGEKQHIVTEEQKIKISNSLSKYFSENRENLSWNSKVYVYNYDGTFYKEYPSIKIAAQDLSTYPSMIHRYLNGSIGKRRPWKLKKQFSREKVELMKDFTKVEKINRRLVW